MTVSEKIQETLTLGSEDAIVDSDRNSASAVAKSKSRMNIFAVTYSAPPLLVPATMRLLKWFNGLTDLGHCIEALAIDSAAFPGAKDETLDALMPMRDVRFHKVGTWDYCRFQELMKRYEKLFFRFLEPGGMGWYGKACRYVRSLDFEKFDLLFSCSCPLSCHLVARRIKKRTRVPWVAFFSDPWVDNPLTPSRSLHIGAYNQSLEASVMEEADRIVFTSSETIDLVMEKYPKRYREKCRVLPHCYVPKWYQQSHVTLPEDGSKIRILHTGSFYSNRTIMPFLKAVAGVLNGIESPLRFAVYLCGDSLAPESMQYIKDNRLEGVFHHLGTVPFLDSLALMKSANFLLLIDAPMKDEGVSVFLPSKLIDYLGSGKPVIGMTPLSGASARVLRETHNFVCAVEDSDSMSEMLKAIGAGQSRFGHAGLAPQQYHYHNVVRTLESIFQEVL